MIAEQLIEYEVSGTREIQLVRTSNEFYIVYLEKHREVKRDLLGYQFTPSYNSFTALKREWRQHQPP